jgi:hypothetical protein
MALNRFTRNLNRFTDHESGRFLKKAAQKLLRCWVMGGVGHNAHDPD